MSERNQYFEWCLSLKHINLIKASLSQLIVFYYFNYWIFYSTRIERTIEVGINTRWDAFSELVKIFDGVRNLRYSKEESFEQQPFEQIKTGLLKELFIVLGFGFGISLYFLMCENLLQFLYYKIEVPSDNRVRKMVARRKRNNIIFLKIKS